MLQDYAKFGRANKNEIIAKYKKEIAIENGFSSWTEVIVKYSGSMIIMNMFEDVSQRCLDHFNEWV